ncbi:MAG: hypothetical protein Alpg2KO_23030 [Alphaproteobacteria bacterium]
MTDINQGFSHTLHVLSLVHQVEYNHPKSADEILIRLKALCPKLSAPELNAVIYSYFIDNGYGTGFGVRILQEILRYQTVAETNLRLSFWYISLHYAALDDQSAKAVEMLDAGQITEARDMLHHMINQVLEGRA